VEQPRPSVMRRFAWTPPVSPPQYVGSIYLNAQYDVYRAYSGSRIDDTVYVVFGDESLERGAAPPFLTTQVATIVAGYRERPLLAPWETAALVVLALEFDGGGAYAHPFLRLPPNPS